MTQQKRLSQEELTFIKTGTTKLTAEALSGTVSRLLSHISAIEAEHKREVDGLRGMLKILERKCLQKREIFTPQQRLSSKCGYGCCD